MNTQQTHNIRRRNSDIFHSLLFKGFTALAITATILSVFTTTNITLAEDQPTKPVKVDHEVTLTNIQFHPKDLKVKKGDTIRFTNLDKFQHDIYLVRTANRNQVLVPATTLDPGKSTIITVNNDGLFTLYCTIHGGMSGMISTTGSFQLTEEEKKKAAALHILPPEVKLGEKLFWGKAQCYQCHSIGDRGNGLRGPNLQDIGFRAKPRAQKLGLESATAYLIQSLEEPSAYIVEGYSNDMPYTYQEPINLSAEDLKNIVSYLQSQGGKVDSWGVDFKPSLFKTVPKWNPFHNGNPDEGKKVFNKMKCFSCHTVGKQESISVGPDFTEIGKWRNWTWISQAILEPNAEIGHNWQSATVFLKPDPDDPYGEVEEVFGILRQSDDKAVKLMVGHNKYETWTPDLIDHIELEKVSRMPTNFGRILSFNDLANLITYITSLKGTKTPPAPPVIPAQSRRDGSRNP